MTGGLRKDAGDGCYFVSGSLAGVEGPGRRTVEHLELRRFSGRGGQGLDVLRSFSDLAFLELRGFENVDLGPLGGLRLRGLDVFGAYDVELAFLNELAGLWRLGLVDVRATAVPALALPETLEIINLEIDDADVPASELVRVVEAIDWSRHRRLKSLRLIVSADHPDAPVEIDLGFLALLPNLERLEIPEGVIHVGPGPSPLEPPFPGLAESVRHVRIDAVDPSTVRAALLERLGVSAEDPDGPSVRPRRRGRPRRLPWEIREPVGAGGVWRAYGRLRDADADDQTEYEAVDLARASIAAVDAALLDRLVVDPENAGTGIDARTREDLERALEILGEGGGREA